MTEKMLKYQFLVFYKEFDEFLGILKSAGVVHIKRLKRDFDEETSKLKQSIIALKQTKNGFEQSIVLNKNQKGENPVEINTEKINDYLNEIQQIEKQLPKLKEELAYAESFGKIESQKIEILKKSKIYFHLFSVAKGKLKQGWNKHGHLETLFETARKSYFVVVNENAEPPKIKAQIEEFPEKSIPELQNEISQLTNRKSELIAGFQTNKNHINAEIRSKYHDLQDQLQNKMAESQKVQLGFGKVIRIVGWIPESKAVNLEALLANFDVYYERENPTPDDNPPILLKNSKFNSWFEPISGLFSLPNYRELDLTPFFAPFFLLFFGFCLGDGGYGLLILLLLLIFKNKVPPNYKNIWNLAVVMESFAVVMGIVCGTFFGINLLETSIPVLSNLRPIMLDADGLFNLALVFGAIQIIYGLLLKCYNQYIQFGWQYAISPFGWILLLFGLGYGYVSGFNLLLTSVSWIGFGLIIIFSDPKAGIGVRLGKGLWDLYGITGFFGDLLSYIRLFALGLAGSILGYVVNDIALSILGSHSILGPIFFVVMLVIGHGLNIFIATLGAFVHPMRLTFVEFYKNAGFAGGGEPYQPLKDLKNK